MLIHPGFNPVILDLNFIQIHWYGLMYVFGFAGAYILASLRKKKVGLTEDDISDLFFLSALGVILGGRLGYCLLYKPAQYLTDPLSIITGIQDGGMSFHGGFIGVVFAVIWFARTRKVPLALISDFVAVLSPIGLFFGRVGNFINQELWGRATDLPWGMVFPLDQQGVARHPSMVYEAIFEGLLLFIVLYVYSSKTRKPWAVTGLFLLGYGISRFLVEFVRLPDGHIGYLFAQWLTIGQIYTIPMIVTGIFLLLFNKRKEKDE